MKKFVFHILVLHLVVTACSLEAQTSKPSAAPAPASINAPALDFEHLSVENGLPTAGISQIIQDAQGFMWIGTTRGFSRFDGYRFKSFNDGAASNTNRIGSTHEDIRALYQAPSAPGFLWIGTNGAGLGVFDLHAETYQNYTRHSGQPTHISRNFVRSIYEAPSQPGILWIGTERGGFNRFDLKSRTFTHYSFDPDDSLTVGPNSVLAFCESRVAPGVLWIGTNGSGVLRFDMGTGAFQRYRHARDDSNTLCDDFVPAIYEAPSEPGMLWLTTANGGLCSMTASRSGKVRFESFRHDPGDANSLSHDAVRAIHEAPSEPGILWVGTDGGGLNRLHRQKAEFSHFMHDPQNPNSLSHNTVTAIVEDHRGALWVGTNGGGLNKMNRHTGKMTHFTHNPDDESSLSESIILSVYEDRSGTLWLGTDRGGLNRFNRQDESFTVYKKDPARKKLLWNRIFQILQDRDGFLWLASDWGDFSRFDPATQSFTHYTTHFDGIESRRVWSIVEATHDSSRVFWLGTRQGLVRFAPGVAERSTWTANRFNKRDVDIQFAGGAKLTRFRRQHGLPNENIMGLLEDNHGNIWISTQNGLAKIDFGHGDLNDPGENPAVINYDVSDGLQGSQFNRGAFYKSKSGEMFFGGINGLAAFFPDSIENNRYLPPVVITGLTKYRNGAQAVEEKGIAFKEEVALSHADNVLSIEFAALSYRQSFKNRYAYKLEGINENWIDLGTQRRITLTNLNPGEYTLHVKGSNNDGIWNEAGASLKLVVSPPPWKTWWAYLLYGIAIFGLLYGLRRYEIKRQQLKHKLDLKNLEAQKLQELDRMKSRFFANISHEFRTPLTLILGPLKFLLSDHFKGNVKTQYKMMVRHGERLLRLINQLLDLSKLESGKLTLQARYSDLTPFLKGIVFSFESLAMRKKIAIEFETDKDKMMLYFDHDKMEQIVTNLLANAFKFTPAGGKISVQLAVVSNQYSEKLNTVYCLL